MERGEHAVFAYGSNLDVGDLARWLKARGWGELRPTAVDVAVLRDWQLVWNYRSDVRRGGAANVTRAPGEEVHGAVLTVNDALLEALDAKEGHPGRYRRERVSVDVLGEDGGPRPAWLYVVTPPYLSEARIPPTAAYLAVVVRGARALGLPMGYVRGLMNTETRD